MEIEHDFSHLFLDYFSGFLVLRRLWWLPLALPRREDSASGGYNRVFAGAFSLSIRRGIALRLQRLSGPLSWVVVTGSFF
jgi:hypothetical protein